MRIAETAAALTFTAQRLVVEEDSVTTLMDRPHTALPVIDVQNGVVGEAHDRDRVVANIAVLVDKAHAAHVPLVCRATSQPPPASMTPRGYCSG